jgi:hypothetical protein
MGFHRHTRHTRHTDLQDPPLLKDVQIEHCAFSSTASLLFPPDPGQSPARSRSQLFLPPDPGLSVDRGVVIREVGADKCAWLCVWRVVLVDGMSGARGFSVWRTS